MAERKPTLASRLFAGGGSAGLLGDPLFRVGMGLLAKGQDNRIPYATAVMQGLQGAQTARDEANRRQMLAEQARREKMKREAYEKAIAQLYPNMPGQMAAQPVPSQVTPGMNMQMMGPPTPPTQNPVASLLSAVGPEAGSAALLSGLLANTNDSELADIQAPSPKDFTPASLREYQRTGDPSVLVPAPRQQLVRNPDGTVTLIDVGTPGAAARDVVSVGDVRQREKQRTRLERGDPDYKDSAFEKIDQIKALIEDPITGEPVDLSPILGPTDSYLVENVPMLKSQESIDLNARLKNVIAIAKLAQRGQLKGQGTISDFEARMLGESVTALSDQNISPELARQELQKLIRRFEVTLNEEDRPGGDDDGGL